MVGTDAFPELLARVRAGDADAAERLVRDYEPAIRRVVRLRLANLALASVLDSTDICQSVLASFFVRVNLGQYSFDSADQLVGLLATMARSKLAAQSRREQAQKRDRRRQVSMDAQETALAGEGATPSRQVAAKELLERVRSYLGNEELKIADLRAQGHDWAEVSLRLHGDASQAEALRKRLARAIDRVSKLPELAGLL